jgi:hypothetical protein
LLFIRVTLRAGDHVFHRRGRGVWIGGVDDLLPRLLDGGGLVGADLLELFGDALRDVQL